MHDIFPSVLAGSPARIIVRGLASLIEEMQRFADSYELDREQVFCRGCEAFRGRRAEDVLREWFRSGDDGARRLEALIDDVTEHQQAIIKALDEVAREAALQAGSSSRFAGPLSWHSRRADLIGNPDLRHANVILPAITREYVRIRKSSRSLPRETGCRATSLGSR